jgi:diguanylate cyclase (GGDEF)-like protein
VRIVLDKAASFLAQPQAKLSREILRVMLFVFTVASLNFALGVAVAIVSSRDWTSLLGTTQGLALAWLRRPRAPSATAERPGEPQVVSPDSQAPIATPQAHRLELPSGWHERLAQHHIEPATILEAALQLARCDEQAHHSRWGDEEQRLRLAIATGSVEGTLKILRAEMSNWLAWVREFLKGLESCQPRLGGDEARAHQLQELLLDQAALVETIGQHLDAIAAAWPADQNSRQLLRECARISERSYVLRDFVLAVLTEVLVARGNLADVPSAWQVDRATGFPNRLGLETVLADWRQGDPTGKRLVSGAFVEIDRLSKINERFGPQRADLVLRAFAKVIDGVVRSDRGDRVVRVFGPTLFVLLSDTGVAGAKAAAERIRQTVEAATFDSGGEEFTLAANCAVCEYMFEDRAQDVLERLTLGIAEAKRGGRNRTAIDEGQGPVLFEAQPIQVRAKTIKIDAA